MCKPNYAETVKRKKSGGLLLQARLDESDRLRKQHVERARYEAELAQRRYMRVDPENRLVADTHEADWNKKLRALAKSEWERLITPRRCFGLPGGLALAPFVRCSLRTTVFLVGCVHPPHAVGPPPRP